MHPAYCKPSMCPPGVWEVTGLNPVGNSDFFFIPHLRHADKEIQLYNRTASFNFKKYKLLYSLVLAELGLLLLL